MDDAKKPERMPQDVATEIIEKVLGAYAQTLLDNEKRDEQQRKEGEGRVERRKAVEDTLKLLASRPALDPDAARDIVVRTYTLWGLEVGADLDTTRPKPIVAALRALSQGLAAYVAKDGGA